MANESPAHGPLSHLRVLDLTVFAQGAVAGQLLREFGADVIKIERPGGGDPGRRLSEVAPGISAFFEPHNRGKRGIVLDLQSDDGREVLLRLAAGADVIVHNLSVGAMERLGLGYEDVREANPGIVYAHGTGLGIEGRDAGLPVVDLLGQARGGLASVTGTEGPTPGGAILSDQFGGMYLLAGILAALVHRERTGEGQFVESSMLGALIGAQRWEISNHLITGKVPKPSGRGHQLLASLWGIYEVADGHIALTGVPVESWPAFCAVIGAEEIEQDPRFATPRDRNVNVPALVTAIRGALRSHELEPLIGAFRRLGVRCTAVATYADVARDEQALANRYVVEVTHPALGDIRVPGNPIRMSATPTVVPPAAPGYGEHTGSVLAELGLSVEEIRGLRASGAVQ
jgi:crotonobetainyl-CoA:carnitine CoA-transferase CaiB-like acyl-CoA transferase